MITGHVIRKMIHDEIHLSFSLYIFEPPGLSMLMVHV
jgi:hypothetical protein